MSEIEKISNLNFHRICLTELSQSRIYKTFGSGQDMNYSVRQIRSKELYVFEVFKNVNDFDKQSRRQGAFKSATKSDSKTQLSIVKGKKGGKTRRFKDIDELQVGMIVDASDYRGSWYAGIVVEESQERGAIKIHFFEFNEKWDEWFTNDDVKIKKRIEPYGYKAEEPADKVF